jgi:uncharacterized protein (TIGR02466 family)
MELTIDQALHRGVTAHKEGKLQDAERLYRAILRAQPKHPDANHNLGVLAVSLNKTNLALSFFKTALEANSEVEQFWVSYIDALIKEKRFDNAKQVLRQGKNRGISGQKIDALENRIAPIISQSASRALKGREAKNPPEKHQGLTARRSKRKVKKQPVQVNNPPEREINQLLHYYNNGQYRDAEKLAVHITHEYPRHYFAWQVLGSLLTLLGRKSEAVDASKEAVALSPRDAAGHNNLAVALQELGDLDEAEGSYNEAIALKPDFTEAHCNLGNTLKELGKFEEAASSYLKAIALEAGYADAHNNLGTTLQELGKLEEAIASHTTAITLKPDYAEAHHNLALALQKYAKLDKAVASYLQAISLKPDYVEAHINLGTTFTELGKLNEAEASYTQSLALMPDRPEVHYNLALTQQKQGKLDEAVTTYQQAIALKSDYADAYGNLGNAYKELNALDKAKVNYVQAIALKSDSAIVHYNLGLTHQELGESDEAERVYIKAIALKPNFPEAYNNLGSTLLEQNKLDEAVASYTQAIALNRDYADAHFNLGSAFNKLDKLDEAEHYYTKAIKLKTNFIDAVTSRAFLYLSQKKYEAALRDADSVTLKGKNKVLPLIALYELNRINEIYKRLEIHAIQDPDNITLAAFAEFISNIRAKPSTYNFCPNPLDFIYFANLSSHVNSLVKYSDNIIAELNKIKTIWEPTGQTTCNGFQSPSHLNIFQNPSGELDKLKAIIISEIRTYYSKFEKEKGSYIEKFPKLHNLIGWTVILKKQGYQRTHIHHDGWLSGVIYLKVIPPNDKDEGAIRFDLNGEHYSNDNSPCLTFQPKEGDIVLFPSSLHHQTIPFSTDTDRIIIAFDLIREVRTN